MHREPHDEMEAEADAFAGEFLVPKDEFSPQVSRLPRLQIRDLIPMKRYWKVSIQALIFRAFEAGAITEAQKRNLFARMSQLNMRQVEPELIDLEVPSNLPRMFTTLSEGLNFTFQEVSAGPETWSAASVALRASGRSPILDLKYRCVRVFR